MEDNYQSPNLDIIEDLLLENGIDVEDYDNPEKAMTQYDAIKKSIMELIKVYFKYHNLKGILNSDEYCAYKIKE